MEKKSHKAYLGTALLLAVSLLLCSSAIYAQGVIYVNDNSTTGDGFTAATGSDVTGNGSTAAPYATIIKAMSLAVSGNTIYVDAGTYNEATAFTITPGVRLIGLCPSSTIIEQPNTTPGNTSKTINVSSNSELSRFTVTRQTPLVNGGQTTISVATAPGATNAKISNCFFTRCRTAVYINSTTANPGAIIENNSFDDNRTGIIMADPAYANIRISGNNILNSRSYGIIITAASSLANILISNNNISGNRASDLDVNGSAAANSITLTNNWFGTAVPVVYAGNTNGGFSVDDHFTGSSYPYNFTDANGTGNMPDYPNDISGTNTPAVNTGTATYAASALPFALPGCCLITSTSPVASYLSIQDAVNGSNNGATITLCAGVYNEQVLVNKSVTIKGAGVLQSTVNFTGVVSGKPTLFDISRPDVSIENIAFKVDLTRLSSAIIASATNVNNLSIKNNSIDAYGSSAAASFGPFGNRNAISVNYTGTTNYRFAVGGVNNVLVSGNTVTGLPNDGFGQARYFRSGVSMDEGGGTFSGNTIQSISQDILVRFGSNGPINVTNNILNGGGLELTDMNAGAGTLSVTGNSFDGTFANIASPFTAVLRLKNNYNAKTTLVTGNTFLNHEWAVSLENYNSVTLDNNSFTPLAGSTGFHHVTVNTKAINTNSATIVQVPVSATLTNNTFNGSGMPGGTAVGFYNHDNIVASFGTFVLGAAGNENRFNAGISKVIYLDHQSGSSGTATFPPYPALIGTSVGATTTMAPWPADLNAEHNLYDLGSGLQLPSAMTLANLFTLEDATQHKIDLSSLGFVTMMPNQDYVTTASFVSPLTTAGSIQRGINAATAGWTVNAADGTYNEDININKALTVLGQSQSAIIRGLYNAAGDAVFMSVSNSTLRNVTVTRDYGTTLASWNADTKNQGINLGQLTTGIVIDRVRLHANRNAIFCNNARDVTITNCTIEDNRTGIHFGNNFSGAEVHNNIIRNNFTHGVLLNYDLAVGITATNAHVTDNSITGNWYSQVNFQRTTGTSPAGDHTGLSFTCNWYGTASPQAVASPASEPGYTAQTPSQFGGTDPGLNRQLYGTEIARCPYIHWLTNGTDNAPLVAGFQPVPGSCNGNYNAPVITCPAGKIITCDGSSDPSNTGMATAPDNCGATTISHSDVTTPGSCAGNYTITRTWTATDACNNQSSCTQIITVKDETAPVITCPANATIACTADNTPAGTGTATATDNCSGVASITHSDVTTPGNCAGNYSIARTWTAMDGCGNTSTCVQTITIQDMTGPTAMCRNVSVTLSGGSATVTPAMVDNGSTDDCSGIASISLSKTSFSCADIGMNPVTLTVTDGCGNSSTCTATVTVTGNMPSTCSIVVTPSNSTYTGGVPTNIYLGYGPQSATITASSTGGSGITYSWSPATYLSCTNCASPVFTPLTPGNYTYTVTVSNSNGCISTCQVTFCVLDIRIPGGNGKVYVCHVPNGNMANANTISVGPNAVASHMAHSGDHLGSCDQICGTTARMIASARIVEEVNVYPNPSNGVFVVELPYFGEEAKIIVTDVQGKTIQTRSVKDGDDHKVNVDLAKSARGIYFLEVIYGEEHFRTKLIVR